MATFKHISSKNADYGAAEQYLTFEHDEFTMKPTLDENGRLMLREDYRIATLNCGDEDFAVACMRSNLRYGKNQKREDVKNHHYIISFDPRDAVDNGLTVDRAQALGEEFCAEHFPGHQAIVCTHPDGHNHSGNIHVHIVINSLRIEEVPLLPYMDRPADTRAGCKHRCTDVAMEYCGKCRTAKEAYFPKETAAWLGHDKHPTECDCQREKRLECESAEERRRHLDTVMELNRRGFTDLTMQEWTFAHDNGKCPQMSKAHLYVEHWEQMRENNYGLLLWGKVGTGKSYFAGCIANALMEQEISVRMTNFSAILNDLTASFEGRNEYIERLCRFPLLILDDFGMERGTEYGLEQVYNVIDSRYRSRKPLIVTTNLSLTELQNPQDTAHARIYDRVLEMCLPILFTGENFRKETAQAKLNGLKELLK